MIMYHLYVKMNGTNLQVCFSEIGWCVCFFSFPSVSLETPGVFCWYGHVRTFFGRILGPEIDSFLDHDTFDTCIIMH